MRRSSIIGLLMVLLAAAAVVPRATAQERRRCFDVPRITNCISGRFLEYWEQNGGELVFGYPITPATDELSRDTGRVHLTQWFERHRFELHPENPRPYDILLGRLGDDRLRQMGTNWQTQERATGKQGCLWFPETGHNVCDPLPGLGFRSYWLSHGLEIPGLSQHARSLALLGLPLTEMSSETTETTGTVLTQWFERARLEWDPRKPDEFKVLPGLLGNEIRNVTP